MGLFWRAVDICSLCYHPSPLPLYIDWGKSTNPIGMSSGSAYGDIFLGIIVGIVYIVDYPEEQKRSAKRGSGMYITFLFRFDGAARNFSIQVR